MGLSRLGAGLALATGLAFAGSALAADHAAKKPASDDSGQANLPKVLQQIISSNHIDFVKSFKTEAPGVTGYVLKQSGQYRIVYGDHGYLLVGNLISPNGDNLSDKYEKQYSPKPDLVKVISKLKSDGHLIQQGPDSAPVVYVFADPNCIFCHRFYEQAEPLIKAGKLQVQWALVGFLKPSSPGRAAAILSAKNPVQALEKDENGFNDSAEEGAIKPVKNVSSDMQKVLKEHAELMASAGGNGTPTLIYKENGQWQSQVGSPGVEWLKKHVLDNKSDNKKQ